METVELRNTPDVKAVIRAAFGDYRKRNALVSVFSGSVQINSYWDGGSKDYFALVELSTLRTRPLPTSTHPFYEVVQAGMANQQGSVVEIDHVGNVYLKVLPPGFALVKGGVFCGKTATAHVYVNPENMPKFLRP